MRRLIDSYGRTINSLRISITNRCNLRCIYCHNEGDARSLKQEASPRTFVNIVNVAKSFGIDKVKFSGGEPLMRKDFEDILKALPPLKDVSATTNGTLLAERAKSLAESGLHRINISLPSLSPEIYRKMTGGEINNVMKGIDAAVDNHLTPVKLNMVLLKINYGEIESMMEFVKGYNGKVILQLIELLDFQKLHRVNIDEVERFLKSKASDIKERSLHRRKKYYIDGIEVELVRPIDNSIFCANCTRLRITSDGKLKPCLMRNDNLVEVDGEDINDIRKKLKMVVTRREPFFKAKAQ